MTLGRTAGTAEIAGRGRTKTVNADPTVCEFDTGWRRLLMPGAALLSYRPEWLGSFLAPPNGTEWSLPG